MTATHLDSSARAARRAIMVAGLLATIAGLAGVAQAAPAAAAIAATVATGDDYESALLLQMRLGLHYPNSREARHLRQTGTVRVWVELDRAGAVIGAGIERHSESPLIDGEALRLARLGRYPAFPPAAFAGEASHRFVVTVEMAPRGQA